MNDYKELIEMLRDMSRAIIRDDSIALGIAEELITDVDADACHKAADAIEQLVKERDGWRMAYDGAKRAHHEWFAEAQKLMKERDALKKKVEERCHICKHYNPSDWEWRGVQG